MALILLNGQPGASPIRRSVGDSMKVLVTGGTGVIGQGVLPALLAAGHEVRLLTRGAEEDARRWPERVEPLAADITDPATLLDAAAGCDAVVHITGIAEEQPPEVTFESVNVGGTRNVLDAAARAGVKRFLYMSSLGADLGSSEYHVSKHAAEELVRRFEGEWVILRPGSVYGPGDEVISELMKMIRALPAIPVVDRGDQMFQPIWFEDLGRAVAEALVSDSASGEVFELGGDDITSTDDLLSRLETVTGRSPARLPVPAFLAGAGARLASIFGVETPLTEAKLTMLQEENVLRSANGLATLGITPTSLDEGLRRLADLMPEQLAESGVGALERKRYWADITGSGCSTETLMKRFTENVGELMAIEFGVEPGTTNEIVRGSTLTASIPLRGTIQMRVEETTPVRITFATLEGHPLAGVVRFGTTAQGDAVRFMVEIFARAATAFDFAAMKTVGGVMQRANWERVVKGMIELSGGVAQDGVQSESVALDEHDAAVTEEWIRDLIIAREHRDHDDALQIGQLSPSAQR